MKWDIRHLTKFQYAAPVRDSFNEIRLKPIHNEFQRLEAFDLRVQPDVRLKDYNDFYANWVGFFEIYEPHSELEIESHARVEVNGPEPLPEDLRPASLATTAEAARGERCFDFVQASRFVDLQPGTWRMAVDAANGETDAWQAALAIMRFTRSRVRYEPLSTHVHTHMREVLAQGSGVCQDFAHVMLGFCRSLRIPALYVSGYLATEAASASHAWVEVFLPGIGWRGLDPTHDRQADKTYIKTAVGRDYADVPPVSGTYRGTAERTMEVRVTISEAPAAMGMS